MIRLLTDKLSADGPLQTSPSASIFVPFVFFCEIEVLLQVDATRFAAPQFSFRSPPGRCFIWGRLNNHLLHVIGDDS